jgi:hypothetical protein
VTDDETPEAAAPMRDLGWRVASAAAMILVALAM